MADKTTFSRGHMTELEIAHQERRNHEQLGLEILNLIKMDILL